MLRNDNWLTACGSGVAVSLVLSLTLLLSISHALHDFSPSDDLFLENQFRPRHESIFSITVQ